MGLQIGMNGVQADLRNANDEAAAGSAGSGWHLETLWRRHTLAKSISIPLGDVSLVGWDGLIPLLPCQIMILGLLVIPAQAGMTNPCS